MGSRYYEQPENKQADNQLIQLALNGDRQSLEKLILRHQNWIYNIAFKMVMDHHDAADVTQEILIKAITSLSSYDPERGAFRTWVYRITANHVLAMKKKKFEYRIHDMDRYVSLIEKMPDDRSGSHPDQHLLEEEVKIGCMTGMMMCLNRRERLVFILGGIFGLTDAEGSQIVEVSRANFRKMLSRARKKILSHMGDFCGHAHPENPCHCGYKVRSFLSLGMADPGNLRFNRHSEPGIREMITEKYESFRDLYYDPFFELYRDQPFYRAPDMTEWLHDILQHEQFRDIFDL